MERKREDWIDVLREAATSGNDKLPEGLWDRISAGLDVSTAKHAGRRRRLYVWSASAAAAVAIAAGIFLMKNSVNGVQEWGTGPAVAVVSPDKDAVPSDKDNDTPIETPIAEAEGQARSGSAAGTSAPVHPYAAEVKVPAGVEGVPVTAQGTNSENIKPASGSTDPENKGRTEKTTGKEDKSRNGAGHPAMNGFDQFPDRFQNDKKASGKKLMLAFSTNGVASVSNTAAASPPMKMAYTPLRPDADGMMVMASPDRKLYRDYDQYSYRHRQPLTFALAFDFSVGHNLFAGAGVSYTRLSSKVSQSNDAREFDQLLQYVGIPVSFKWAFLNSNWFMMYAGAQVQPEFNVGAQFDGAKVDVATMQWSVHAVAGAQVNLGKHIGIYVEPKLSHYFRETDMKTIRNTKGVNFNLEFGLRFSY